MRWIINSDKSPPAPLAVHCLVGLFGRFMQTDPVEIFLGEDSTASILEVISNAKRLEGIVEYRRLGHLSIRDTTTGSMELLL